MRWMGILNEIGIVNLQAEFLSGEFSLLLLTGQDHMASEDHRQRHSKIKT